MGNQFINKRETRITVYSLIYLNILYDVYRLIVSLTEDGESVRSGSDSEGQEYTIDKLDSTSAKRRLKQSRRSTEQNDQDMNKDRIAVCMPSLHVTFTELYNIIVA